MDGSVSTEDVNVAASGTGADPAVAQGEAAAAAEAPRREGRGEGGGGSTAAATPGSPAPDLRSAGPPLLDPAATSLRRGPSGDLRLVTPEVAHLWVRCYRAFPLSAPDGWVVFFDKAGGHIGLMESLTGLDPESAALCREELELRYVVPLVREVRAIREEFGENRWNPAQVWDVDTDRGPLRLHLPNLADHIRAVGEGRLLFTDRDQRRCLLRPVDLSPRSRALVGRYLWLDGVD